MAQARSTKSLSWSVRGRKHPYTGNTIAKFTIRNQSRGTYREGYTEVLDADIQTFYDTIPQKLIMDRLREKIADGWVLNSIENMLKAGVMEDGILHKTTKEALPAALVFVKEIIEGKLGMKLSEDKTKLTNFKRGFRWAMYKRYIAR